MPDDLMPIGHDGIGNIICIGIRNEIYGKIFIWWEDGQSEIGETPTYKNVDFVAPSFGEFANGLTKFKR